MTAPASAGRHDSPDLGSLTLSVSAARVNVLLIIGHVYFGAGLLVGGQQYMSSGSYVVAREWGSISTWGWALALGAVLALIAPWLRWWGSVTMHLLAAVPPLAMTVALVLGTAQAQGWGGPVLYLVPVGLHLWIAGERLRNRHDETWEPGLVLG